MSWDKSGRNEMDVMWMRKQKTRSTGAAGDDRDHEPTHRLHDEVVRRFTGMRPEILDDMGLVAAIGWQAKEFEKRLGIRCRVELPAEYPDLGSALATAVFRIFQEILTNIARHAKASSVSVQLRISKERLTLEVADDGSGIADNAVHARESLGLLGMQERAQLFGGEVKIRGTPGHGTTVSLAIPLSQSHDGEMLPQ